MTINRPRPAAYDADHGSDRDLVLDRIVPLASSREAAERWLETYPIPAFGGKTGEQLLLSGQRQSLEAYLDAVEAGAYA